MARKLLVALAVLALVGGCAAQLDAEDVQSFVNVISNKVNEVKSVSPPEASAMLQQISDSIQGMANSIWAIQWSAGPQSQWDQFVLLANTLTQQIWQIESMIPENSGQTWGSIYPRADLRSVGTEVCDQVAAMQKAAQQQYGVLLTITSMTACELLEPAAAAPSPSTAPAPAPAPTSRRMLKA